jgi:hypothetical protein
MASSFDGKKPGLSRGDSPGAKSLWSVSFLRSFRKRRDVPNVLDPSTLGPLHPHDWEVLLGLHCSEPFLIED